MCASFLTEDRTFYGGKPGSDLNGHILSIAIGAVRSTGHPDIFTINPSDGAWYEGYQMCSPMYMFDASSAKLSAAYKGIYADLIAGINEGGGSQPVVWRDCMYVSDLRGAIRTARLTKPGLGKSALVGSVVPANHHAYTDVTIEMNDRFLVRFGKESILSMCFDEDIDLPTVSPQGSGTRLVHTRIGLVKGTTCRLGSGRSLSLIGGRRRSCGSVCYTSSRLHRIRMRSGNGTSLTTKM